MSRGVSTHVVVLSVSAISAAFVLWVSGQLPQHVGSHFGISGSADAFMSRRAFVGVMMFAAGVLPYGLWRLQVLMARREKINVPNRAHWYAEPQRTATLRFLEGHAAWFAVVLAAFVGAVHWLVVRANAGDAPQLDNTAILILLGLFISFGIGWVVALYTRFRR